LAVNCYAILNICIVESRKDDGGKAVTGTPEGLRAKVEEVIDFVGKLDIDPVQLLLYPIKDGV
jgi:hypothetical protein